MHLAGESGSPVPANPISKTAPRPPAIGLLRLMDARAPRPCNHGYGVRDTIDNAHRPDGGCEFQTQLIETASLPGALIGRSPGGIL